MTQLHRTAKVAPLDDERVEGLDECVVGLEVAVQDTAGVHVGHAQCELVHDLQQEPRSQLLKATQDQASGRRSYNYLNLSER